MDNTITSHYKEIPIPKQSLTDFVFQRIRNHVDLVAMIEPHSGRQYTYRELMDKVKRAASGFCCHGVKKGDVVLIISPNDMDIGVSFLALASLGAITTTADPASTEREIKFQQEDTAASFVICAEETARRTKEALNDFKTIKVITFGKVDGMVSFEDVISSGVKDLVSAEIDPDDVLLILYSSGTTGTPKGVIHTHRMIVTHMIYWNSSDVSIERDPNSPGSECLIMSLPFRHSFGLVHLFLEAIYCGNTLVVMKQFVFENYVELIHRFKATILHLLPNMVVSFVKHPVVDRCDFSNVHTVVCSGDALGKKLLEDLETKLGGAHIRQCYGMTETNVTCMEPKQKQKHGCAGILLPSVQIKVVDIEDRRALDVGRHGEICLKSDFMTKGYFKRPEATKAMFDKDGWFLTGDIGFYDEDEHVCIVGRLKEIIKCDGFQVPPAELEHLLLTHPGVAEAAVCGIPDEMAGELAKAFVVQKDGYNLSEKEIIEFVKENIVPSKYLRGGVQFVDKLPKSASGKIIRYLLRGDK